MSNSVSNPGCPYFRCEETDADDKCDFFQWADGKTKVRKSMTKKKRDLKRLQKRTSAVKKPKKVMKRIKPLQSSDEEKYNNIEQFFFLLHT